MSETNNPVPATTLYPGQSYTIYTYNSSDESTIITKLMDNSTQPLDSDPFPSYKIRNFQDDSGLCLSSGRSTLTSRWASMVLLPGHQSGDHHLLPSPSLVSTGSWHAQTAPSLWMHGLLIGR